MTATDESLGRCPMCSAAFIRNRRDKHAYRSVSLPGEAAPANAYYPEVRFDVLVVWCPGCGLVKSVQSTDLRLLWLNPEIEEYRRKQT